MVGRTCEIEGCPKAHYGRGMCRLHWDRWYDGRDLHNPTTFTDSLVNRPNGLRRCSTCRVEKEPAGFHRNRSRPDGLMTECKACVITKKRACDADRRALRPERQANAICDVCGSPFSADGRRRLRCSAECSRVAKAHADAARQKQRADAHRDAVRRYTRRHPNKNAAKSAAYRARIARAFVEDVVPSAVFERDGWRCGICGSPIEPSSLYPEPVSASVDHIVPLSRGGSHAYDNVQAAHLVCNLRKGGDLLVG